MIRDQCDDDHKGEKPPSCQEFVQRTGLQAPLPEPRRAGILSILVKPAVIVVRTRYAQPPEGHPSLAAGHRRPRAL